MRVAGQWYHAVSPTQAWAVPFFFGALVASAFRAFHSVWGRAVHPERWVAEVGGKHGHHSLQLPARSVVPNRGCDRMLSWLCGPDFPDTSVGTRIEEVNASTQKQAQAAPCVDDASESILYGLIIIKLSFPFQ